jgi:hypothetical protein
MVKLKIHVFQRKNDLKVYPKWEKKVKWIFDCHLYIKQIKVKLVVIKFTYYALIWWDQLVLNNKRNKERLIDS